MPDNLSNEQPQKTDVFAVEKLFKKMFPYITEQDKNVLQNWQQQRTAYNSSWETFKLDNSVVNANNANEKTELMIGIESSVNASVSNVYLTTPSPEEITGKWDGGQEKQEAQSREANIAELEKIIADSYIKVKTNKKVIAQVLDATSSETLSSNTLNQTTPDKRTQPPPSFNEWSAEQVTTTMRSWMDSLGGNDDD